MTAQHHELAPDVIPGNAPPCPTDCEYRGLCTTCGYPLCPEHEPAAVSECGEAGAWHHEDACAQAGCGECDETARWDHETERGDAMREEGWR